VEDQGFSVIQTRSAKVGVINPKRGGLRVRAAFLFVRPAGRTHLKVKVLYGPGRGNR